MEEKLVSQHIVTNLAMFIKISETPFDTYKLCLYVFKLIVTCFFQDSLFFSKRTCNIFVSQ